MEKKILHISEICGLVIAALFCFFNWRISRGIVLGLAFFRLYFFLLSTSMSEAMSEQSASAGTVLIYSIGRMVAMALPLLIGVLLPQYFHIIGCFIGFMIFKIAAIIAAVRK
ncbi:MAG: ATP synthase subunit I [Erysipelotrichaceae bacterium]|nr:ATP synthase subunit I [Erysipelotrichaceae bacterium]